MKRRKRKRFVYVIARPLKNAGSLDFLSDGKYHLCHWALLVTHSRPELGTNPKDSLMGAQSSTRRHLQGTLFELCRSPNGLNFNIVEDFKLEKWWNEWSFVMCKYAGETRVSNQNLSDEGEIYNLSVTLTIYSKSDYTFSPGL